MFVEMLKTRKVSEDGHTLKRCKEGETYDLAHETACRVIRQGWGARVDEKTIVDYRMAYEGAKALLQHAIGYEFGEAVIQRQKEEVFFARIELEQAERVWA